MKLSKLSQIGLYERNGIQYRVEILSSPTRARIDFYQLGDTTIRDTEQVSLFSTNTGEQGNVTLSEPVEIDPLDEFDWMYTVNSDALNSGLVTSVFKVFGDKTTTEVYGDELVYFNFETVRMNLRLSDNFDVESKGLGLTEYGPKSQQIRTREGSDESQILTYIDTLIVEEETNTEAYKLSLKTDNYSYGKSIKKITGLSYASNKAVVDFNTSRPVNMRSLEEVAIEKDLSYLKTKQYYFVDSIEDFDRLVDRLMFFNGVLAFDTETTGLNVNRFPEGYVEESNGQERAKLVGLCLSYEEGTGYYIPVRSSSPTYSALPLHYVLKRLKKILQEKHLVTHNGGYDWKVMWTFGIDINIVDDTYLLQYLIDVRQSKAVKKLKVMAENLLGHATVELEDFFPKIGKKKQRITFDTLPKKAVSAYGPADADFTLTIRNILINKLPDSMRFIYGQEIKLMKNIAIAEYYGFRIDLDKLDEYETKCEETIPYLEKQIYQLAGKQEDSGFNISSSDQLARLLYEELQYPVLVKIKGTEKPSTDKKAMKALAAWEKREGKGPLCKTILAYKKEKKLYTAFYKRLKKDQMGGFVFPKYNQAGTESGRVAGYNPNLQQVDNMIKDLFVSDGPEWSLFDADYAQIEYRVMASLSRETKLIEQFKDPDADFHIMMAALLFGVPENDVTSAMRKASKALNFGIPYGMGDESLAEGIHGDVTPEHVADAKAKKDAYYESVPNVRDMFISIKSIATLQQYTETLFRRRRYYPKIQNGTNKEIAEAKRQAGNTYIQGSAADILKIAYNRLMEIIIRRYGMPKYDDILDGTTEVPATPLVRVSANIHDEMLGNFHKSIDVFELISLIKLAMEYNVTTSMPFTPIFAGISICDNWAQGKSDDYEMPVRMTDEILAKVKAGELKQDPNRSQPEQVRAYIDDFQRRRLVKHFETHANIKKDSTKTKYVNYNVVNALMKDWKIARVITKYFPWGIDLEGNNIDYSTMSKDQLEACKDTMFANQLRFILITEYGADAITYDSVQASSVDSDMFDDSNEELEYLVDDMDTVLDEDALSDYGVAEVINLDAYRQLSAKGKEITTDTVIKTAANVVSQSRLVVFDRTYNFDLTGISVDGLKSFMAYMVSIKDDNGYTFTVTIDGTLKIVPFKVAVTKRERLMAEIMKYVTDTPVIKEAN